MDSDSSLKDFENRMAHAYRAYQFFESAIPRDSAFRRARVVRVKKIEFRKVEDAHSMRVELGWAFFVRMDAVFEFFLQDSEGNVKWKALVEELRGCTELSNDERLILQQYRDIRNALHHDDGKPDPKRKSLPDFGDGELQFSPASMKRWYGLFLKVGRIIGSREESQSNPP